MADLFQCWLYWNIYDKNGAFLREYFLVEWKAKQPIHKYWCELNMKKKNSLVFPNSHILALLHDCIIESTISTAGTVE